MSAPLRNELVRPLDVDRCLDGADRGDGAAAFGHQQPRAGAHALQVTTEMRLQLTDADGIQMRSPGEGTTILARCGHIVADRLEFNREAYGERTTTFASA